MRSSFAVLSLGLVVSLGHALAFGPSAVESGRKVARISFIDRALNVTQLSDGMGLRAPDQRMLADLKVGQWVKVEFVSDGERPMINSTAPAQAGEIPGTVSRAVGGATNREA